MKVKTAIFFAFFIGVLCGVLSVSFICKNPIEITELEAPTWPEGALNHEVTIIHKDGKQVRYPIGKLLQLHGTNAWNDCLVAFSTNRDWLTGKAWSQTELLEPFTQPWIVDAPDEVNAMREIGWKACSKKLQLLCDSHSEKDVRRVLKIHLQNKR
ncbi:hypothetical protein SH449x_002559 [Pirellulaceae bacterium SH449]